MVKAAAGSADFWFITIIYYAYLRLAVSYGVPSNVVLDVISFVSYSLIA